MIRAQKIANRIASLPEPFTVIGVPGTGLFQHFLIDTEIYQLAGFRDALSKQDIEFSLFERWSHLVLDDLHEEAAPDYILPFLDRFTPADIQPDRRIELERVAPGRRLGIAEHDAELHANLVDEDDRRLRFRDGGRELSQGLRHQSGLKAHVGIAHLAFDLSPWRQRSHRIHDNHIDGTAANERLCNFQGLFTRIRL